jgi:CIC family chloride channel protein
VVLALSASGEATAHRVAAVLGAPISTILMGFELTGDYATTVAVMIATVIASTVTHQLFKHSYFTWQLALRGLDVRGGREQNLLRAIRVATVMTSAYDSVVPTARLAALRHAPVTTEPQS